MVDAAADAVPLGDYLPVAIRPWAIPVGWQRGALPRVTRRPMHLLVLDCETRLSSDQRLSFGSARLYRRTESQDADQSPSWEWFSEYVFYGDDIEQPELKTLESWLASLPTVERFDPLWSPDREAFTAAGTTVHINEHGVSTFLVPRWWFVRHVFRPFVYEDARALVVAYNAPFDLSRLARGWGEARAGSRPGDEEQPRFDAFAGGFSLWLEEYRDPGGQMRENTYARRIAVKTIDSKRHLIALRRAYSDTSDTGDAEGPRYSFPGNFLDLHTLAYALTNTNYSLRRACEAFGVVGGKLDWAPTGTVSLGELAYNRQDVAATFALAMTLLAEYDRHPISPGAGPHSVRTLSETRAYSPASIGKAYLRGMGLRPVLERQAFPAEVLGYAMTAFYGGRAECRIRRAEMPVVYCDFLSMYPTVNANMDLWRLLTAEEIELQDATAEVTELLRTIEIDDLYDPLTWRRFPVLVECQPAGEILPARVAFPLGSRADVRTAPDWQIGVNPLWSEGRPLWYALPDLVAAKVLGGRAPKVIRAIRLVARGQQASLHPVRLRGQVAIDPVETDFFRALVEERHTLRDRGLPDHEEERLGHFLKTFANSVSYGIYAEMVRHQLPQDERAEVAIHGLLPEPATAKVSAPETPGEYCFPPVAACITAAARLMLALLERAVTDAGGSYVFTDTDSMAIVATERGGPIPCAGGPIRTPDGDEAVLALSWDEVDRIRLRFNALTPYGPAVTDDVLKLERHNFDHASGERRQLYAYAVSAKRYALYNRSESGEWVPRRCSEHGLGHLLDPAAPVENPGRDPTQLAEMEVSPEPDDEPEEGDSGLRPWICRGWEWIVATGRGNKPSLPDWAERPAVAQISASTPRVLTGFRAQRSAAYAERIKPFNFLLAAHVDRLELTAADANEPFHLVAPYSRDPAEWLTMPWFDRYSGREYSITTSDVAVASVRVKTYGDILSEHRFRVERKFIGPHLQPIGRTTSGHLQRRPVRVRDVTYIGKESNKLADRPTGLIQGLDEVLTHLPDERVGSWQAFIRPRLSGIPTRDLAQATGRDRSTVKRWKAGTQRPRPKEILSLLRLIDERSRG